MSLFTLIPVSPFIPSKQYGLNFESFDCRVRGEFINYLFRGDVLLDNETGKKLIITDLDKVHSLMTLQLVTTRADDFIPELRYLRLYGFEDRIKKPGTIEICDSKFNNPGVDSETFNIPLTKYS